MIDQWISDLGSPDTIRFALMLNALATWYMVGVIVFVQVAHYPLFRDINPEGFAAYSERNQWLTSFVVGPPMIVEAAIAACLMIWLATPAGAQLIDGRLALWNVGLLLVIFGVTAIFSIPCHAVLAKRYDLAVIRRLVITNWLRTVTWVGKGILAVQLLMT
jgi:hypothetical protein